MAKRFQEVVMYRDHLHMHGVIDTKTGKFSRFYDMENDETDRIQRETNIRNEKDYPEQMPHDGATTILREWD